MNSDIQAAVTEWEYKILISPTGAFKNQDIFQQSLMEETPAGWTLVEKFDDKRLRLKRPVSARERDASLGFNPYRTMTTSMGEAARQANKKAWMWISLLLVGVAIFFVFMFTNS